MSLEPKFYQMSPVEKQQIVEIIINALKPREEIKFAFIYGSFYDPQGDNLPFRDIDVGVYTQGINEKTAVYYEFDLSEQLSTLVKMPVDVRVINFAPLTFQFHVVRGQLIIDNDEDPRCEFMEHVARHYLDMKPLYIRAIKEAFGT